MACPIEFENKATANPWALVGMGIFVWFISSIIVFEIFRQLLPPKEWTDIYTMGAKLLQGVVLAGFTLTIGINIPEVINNWLKKWREHSRVFYKYFVAYAVGMLVITAVLAMILVFLEKTGKIDPAITDALNKAPETNANIIYLKELFQESILRFTLLLGTMCIIAPVIEEVFFRRFLFVALRKRAGFITSLTITTVLFAALHSNLALGAIGGIYLGYVYEKGKSLPANIAIHSTVNFLVTSISLVL